MYQALPIVFAAGAVAQSTITTQFLNLGFDNVPLASVIGADSNAVTYSIGCAQTDIDNGDCGLYTGFTVTAGPSIFEFQYTDDTAASGYTADFSDSVSCAVEGTTQAVCVESAGGSEANFPGVSTATVTGTDLSWGSLLITAGFDKLSATAGAGASASGSQASATGSSSSASETGGSSSNAQSGSRTSAGASTTGSASSTATASKSGSASGSAASATSTGGAAAQFAVPIAGVVGVLAAALAL
ncbi:putative gpi anchored [Botryosphaeria dothidea]|uniref:Putative gpi anchored n=1 Tax=Botryosphaeria dothidea TaxID=55169 RepID=A0A8H4J1G0_9PEZI|nr:putative gpi anchored [Botryosphaeria dothidea]KAF4311973.1 putative gpi anchored [Botryosphaeria dothidea]